jgi:membrane AbrB-like protein
MSQIASLRPLILRLTVSLALAIAAALAFERLHIPIPWMLGPLVSLGIANLLGNHLEPIPYGRQAGQVFIGTGVGLYFTPTVLAALVEQSWVIVLGGILVMVVAAVGGRLLARVSGIDKTTCFFATVPGGAAEMAVLAARYGGVVPAVAIAQAIRVTMLVIVLPAVVTYSGVAAGAREPPLALPFAPSAFAIMIAISAAAGLIFQKLKLQNPWMMGPLLVTAALAVFEFDLSAIPRLITNGSQLMLGMALGSRFEREFFLRYRLFIPIALINGTYIILASAAVALVVTWMSGIPLATALTGCGPGGIAEMTITAKALSLGVATVTAFQLVRIVLANFGAAYVLRLAVGNVKPVASGPKF